MEKNAKTGEGGHERTRHTRHVTEGAVVEVSREELARGGYIPFFLRYLSLNFPRMPWGCMGRSSVGLRPCFSLSRSPACDDCLPTPPSTAVALSIPHAGTVEEEEYESDHEE